MNLSRKQQETLDDMRNAPVYDMGTHQWCDTYLIPDDRRTCVNGNWHSTTLNALERKGFIEIVKDGGWWNDIIYLRG